ncbi:SemiSWEET transporter [Hymenobacter sp. RP-2-7]|uniref:SemiSWEET transporter n=1 Tax=Hymenobacter polaris TaxID=2682546 RepID=A0A7Y0ABV4_9BACT|nr:SemiSWEET transporter [Hymenobacter polaris]NML64463.1 SemiSWEET transporter [Hymenobacter polaris]
MDVTTLLGTSAAVITTAGYVPQAYQTIRTRSTASLSLSAYLLLTAGTALWTTYGIVAGNWPIIVSNGITAALAAIILVLKLTAKPSEEPVADGGHPTK